MSAKIVNLDISNGEPVPPPECRLSKNGKETILWRNNSAQDLVVTFTGNSPFAEQSFTVERHRTKPSGEITAENLGAYDYKIEVALTGAAADPQVIIDR